MKSRSLTSCRVRRVPSASRILGWSLPPAFRNVSGVGWNKPAEPQPAKAPAKTAPRRRARQWAAPAPTATPAPAAPTAQSFDELLKGAVPAKDLTTLLENRCTRAVMKKTACRSGSARAKKAYLLDYLRGHSFVAEADVQPDTTPYDATAKQVDLEVPGCLACSEPRCRSAASRASSSCDRCSAWSMARR